METLTFTKKISLMSVFFIATFVAGCSNSRSALQPTHSQLPVQSIQSFSITDANQTVPSDVLEEIAFFGTGEGPTLCGDFGDNYYAPTIVPITTEPIEYTEIVEFLVCGLQSDDPVSVVITSRNGIRFNDTLYPRKIDYDYSYEASGKTVDYYETSGYYQIGRDFDFAPEVYTVAVAQNAVKLQYSFKGMIPSVPRVYEVEGKLTISNFQPYEEVRLFAYKFTGRYRDEGGEVLRLIGWRQYTVNEQGDLQIQVDPTLAYFVIGDVTGEVAIHGTMGFENIHK